MQKHIPLRQCAGCGEMKEKSQLFRIVCIKNGGLSRSFMHDKSMKAQGRGLYICKSEQCIAKAEKSKRFKRFLGAEAQNICAQLKNELNDWE
ncbi:MAG: YlxR family protein [Clostridiales bacterium]|nr:YlxR family protein [Clostridiales bacterium]